MKIWICFLLTRLLVMIVATLPHLSPSPFLFSFLPISPTLPPFLSPFLPLLPFLAPSHCKCRDPTKIYVVYNFNISQQVIL